MSWKQEWYLDEPWYHNGKEGKVRSFIYPEDERHDIRSFMCRCSPVVGIRKGVLKLVHNAFDRRDVIEQAEAILSDVKDKP